MKPLVLLFLILLMAGWFRALSFGAQAPPPAQRLTPTTEQQKDLQLAWDQVKLAGDKVQFAVTALQQAQANFESQRAALQAAADKIRAANKWGADAVYNEDANVFTKPLPAKPTPTAEQK